MTWQAVIDVVVTIAVSVIFAVLLTRWLRSQEYEIRRRPVRDILRPRLIACVPIAFATAIGWRLAGSPPPWWVVPVGVLVGLGALASLVFTVLGLLFDLEKAQRRTAQEGDAGEAAGAQ